MTHKFKANLLISLIIVAIALPIAALADQRIHRGLDEGLRIAIDDGTPGNELYVDIDYGDAGGRNRHERRTFDISRSVAVMAGHEIAGEPGVTVISSRRIDEETRQGIRALLSDAGHAAGVVFIDGSEFRDAGGGPEQLTRRQQSRNISEEIEATN